MNKQERELDNLSIHLSMIGEGNLSELVGEALRSIKELTTTNKLLLDALANIKKEYIDWLPEDCSLYSMIDEAIKQAKQ